MAFYSFRLRWVISHPFKFLWRVLLGFRDNQGMLLSGAVAYYSLLSIIPLLILILLALSQVLTEQELLNTLGQHLNLVVAGESQALLEQLAVVLSQREKIGWLLIVVLLFFSSMAFTVLENAMSVIFFHRVVIKRRHFMVSALLPYLYILSLGLGFLLVTLISGALQTVGGESFQLWGTQWSLSGLSGLLLYFLGVVGEILMLASLYWVMPVGKLSWKHALLGGVVAGILWEFTRHLLVWYFASLSVVNVVYGSLATTIVALLSLEMAGMIILLGAQVIAEYERLGGEDDGAGLSTG
ncbi:MAG: YihY/virulence factor BrkB family protein [Gammaproteobacteria bacterium]|nr:YihY/virulence factor BrkB family protein [Gammaproteobacteria bacterium]